MSLLKLYGVPLSQPTRSVAWALLLKQTPFQFVLTVPGLSKPGLGARDEAFRSKTKACSITVPLLEDGNNVAITESAAILIYLCESRGWTRDWYGAPGTLRKATIDSYLHWHHTNTRLLGRIASGYLQSHTPRVEQETEEMSKVLKRLEQGWLAALDDAYLVGGDTPTVADLLCYEEIAQITMLGLFPEPKLAEEYPNLYQWTQRMKQLPYHEAVHTGLRTLGDVTADNPEVPLAKRLSRATKAGMAAIEEAQKEFSSSEVPPSKL